MTRIHFVASNRAGSRVRTIWPAEALAARGWAATSSFRPPEPGSVDVLIIHRPTSQDAIWATQAHQAAGALVLMDEDDDLTCVPERHGWVPTAGTLALHDQAIALADGLIVSTERLKEVYGPLAKRSWVIRNYLPQRLMGYRRPRPDDGVVRVGWAGIVKTHAHDLEWVGKGRWRRLLRQPGVGFTSVGDPTGTREVMGLKSGEGELYGFSFDEREFYGDMSRADVGVVPLEPGRFNEAKSWLKALEFSFLGVPAVIVSALPEQELLWAVAQDAGCEVFGSATDPDEFVDMVHHLAHEPALRQVLAEGAIDFARVMTLERHVYRYEQVFNKLGVAAPGGKD